MAGVLGAMPTAHGFGIVGYRSGSCAISREGVLYYGGRTGSALRQPTCRYPTEGSGSLTTPALPTCTRWSGWLEAGLDDDDLGRGEGASGER